MAMRECADTLKRWNCDENYPIIASYTYNAENLTKAHPNDGRSVQTVDVRLRQSMPRYSLPLGTQRFRICIRKQKKTN